MRRVIEWGLAAALVAMSMGAAAAKDTVIIGHTLEPPGLDHPLRGQSERAAFRQLVVQPAPEQPIHPVAPQRPGHPRSRRLVLQAQEVERDVDRRMSAADHQYPPPGIVGAIAVEHVGNAVGDARGRRAFSRMTAKGMTRR